MGFGTSLLGTSKLRSIPADSVQLLLLRFFFFLRFDLLSFVLGPLTQPWAVGVHFKSSDNAIVVRSANVSDHRARFACTRRGLRAVAIQGRAGKAASALVVVPRQDAAGFLLGV